MTCPRCGEPYSRKVGLTSRSGKRINVSNFRYMCQVAKKRQGGPTPKKTRSDSEKYTFIGYLHK